MKKQPPFELLWEDEHLAVVNKPAGVLSIPGRHMPNAVDMRHLLQQRYGEIFVVHRLDKDTSGVMVFAKNAAAHKALNTQFEQREVQKVYHALVSGVVTKDELDIDIPLMRDARNSSLMRPSVRGKESLTKVQVLQRFKIATLLECRPETGRQHQIRVHCATVGHPLFVDPVYGKHSEFRLSSIKRRYNLAKDAEERPLISRLTLHARTLTFHHPVDNREIEMSAEYPKDLRATLKVLTKYAPLREVTVW